MLGDNENSLLHFNTQENTRDIADMIGRVQYICDQCPALILLKDSEGSTAFHVLLTIGEGLNFECVKILCDMDLTVVRDTCTPSNVTSPHSGMLPLHFFLSVPISDIRSIR
jgi:hypothetical protein